VEKRNLKSAITHSSRFHQLGINPAWKNSDAEDWRWIAPLNLKKPEPEET